ncbi:MAG: C39 family peptidase [Patescibacteria group bacterium]
MQRNLRTVFMFLLILFVGLGATHWYQREVSGFKYGGNSTIERVSKQLYYSAVATLPHIKPATKDLAVRFHRQEHALSCEIAALKMALNFKQKNVSETELWVYMPYDVYEPRSANNVWGDPDKGFVGSINGTMPNSGYGIYEGPIADLAHKYGEAKAINGGTLAELIAEIDAGNPVIVWSGYGRDISWNTPEGKFVRAYKGTHVRVLTGYVGSAENPESLIMMDPIYGKVWWSQGKFMSQWEALGRRAVVVY